MDCGCNSSANTSGPLLSGNLDPAFSPTSQTSDASLLDAITGGAAPFSAGSLFKIALVLVFIGGAAWMAHNAYKEKKA